MGQLGLGASCRWAADARSHVGASPFLKGTFRSAPQYGCPVGHPCRASKAEATQTPRKRLWYMRLSLLKCTEMKDQIHMPPPTHVTRGGAPGALSSASKCSMPLAGHESVQETHRNRLQIPSYRLEGFLLRAGSVLALNNTRCD